MQKQLHEPQDFKCGSLPQLEIWKGPVGAISKLREDHGQHQTMTARTLLNRLTSAQVQTWANILVGHTAFFTLADETSIKKKNKFESPRE